MSNAVHRVLSARGTALVMAVAVGVLVPAGCGGEEPAGPPATNPPNTGATCDDDTGDLSRDERSLGGNLREPAGVDLTHAEARVTDTALKVSFTTAGPIAGAPDPEFRLGQGTAGQAESFELIAAPRQGAGTTDPTAARTTADPLGPWDLSLVTFRPDGRGGMQEAPRTVLRAPVTVDGNRLSYEVPLRDLPAIATYIWLFGASSTSPDGTDTVVDDCDRYTGAATVPPAAAAPGAGAALGETLNYPTGSQVTVYAVEPAAAEGGTTDVAVDVKVCAPASAGVETRRDYISLATGEDRSYPAKEVAAPRDPAFPATVVLDPGACRRAWVTVPVPGSEQPAAVVYSPEASGAGALRWRLR